MEPKRWKGYTINFSPWQFEQLSKLRRIMEKKIDYYKSLSYNHVINEIIGDHLEAIGICTKKEWTDKGNFKLQRRIENGENS